MSKESIELDLIRESFDDDEKTSKNDQFNHFDLLRYRLTLNESITMRASNCVLTNDESSTHKLSVSDFDANKMSPDR